MTPLTAHDKKQSRAVSARSGVTHPGSAARRNRRGAIFIIALAMIVILSALLLVFAQQMRTESSAGANRLSAVQADGVEQGAEQWVLAQVEANTAVLPAANSSAASASASTTAIDVTTIPAEALQVGGGYFWLLHPDPTQDQTYAFGIVDESGKLNLNAATSDQLILLPNMLQDVADSTVAWASTSTAAPAGDAAGTDYYGALPEPYTLKGSAFETVEEMLLIKDCTPQMLYGYDLNHDGVLDDNERAASNGAAVTNGTTSDSRGFANYVTVYSTNAQPVVAGAAVVPPRPGVRTVGLINVNTAPEQVLLTLPNLTTSDADALISARTGSATVGSTAWVAKALTTAKANALASYITATSYQYSADIVAVSGDGRSYKRVRIVVDARKQPAKIVYRKDITSLGWPLPADVRTSLRAGKGVPQYMTGTSNVQGSGGMSSGLSAGTSH